MQENRKFNLSISILGKDHVIAVTRDVIRILGNPKYVCILKNEEQHAIALQACDEKHLLSFKVPDTLFQKGNSSSFRIYSMPFTDEILGEYHLDYNVRHRFIGDYVKEHRAVIFSLESVIENETAS